MEYYLVRAMEVCRLSQSQSARLHAHEASDRISRDFDPILGTYKETAVRGMRCLMPYEIQEKFGLPTLKEAYGIPEDDQDQAKHNQRLRKDFAKNDIFPKGGDLSTMRVREVHDFDLLVRSLNDQMKIDLCYRGGRQNKSRISENI